jgi:hypothetical protein
MKTPDTASAYIHLSSSIFFPGQQASLRSSSQSR